MGPSFKVVFMKKKKSTYESLEQCMRPTKNARCAKLQTLDVIQTDTYY